MQKQTNQVQVTMIKSWRLKYMNTEKTKLRKGAAAPSQRHHYNVCLVCSIITIKKGKLVPSKKCSFSEMLKRPQTFATKQKWLQQEKKDNKWDKAEQRKEREDVFESRSIDSASRSRKKLCAL